MPYQNFDTIPNLGAASEGAAPIYGYPTKLLKDPGGTITAAPPGLTFTSRLRATPSQGETWKVVSVSYFFFLQYREEYFYINKAAKEKLESAAALAQQVAVESAPGKAQAEAALVREQINKEILEYGVAQAKEKLFGASPFNVAARIFQGGNAVWTSQPEARRSLFSEQGHSFQSEGTMAEALFTERFEIFEALPIPLTLYSGQDLTFSFYITGPPPFVVGKEGVRIAGGGVGEARVAIPRIEISYEHEPIKLLS